MIPRALAALILWSFVSSPPLEAAEEQALALFRQESAKTVSATLKRREGVVLWWDRHSPEPWVFGNPELLNRSFLPGSWLKLAVAEVALAAGIDPAYTCRGHDKIGGKRRTCWTHRGHGSLDLARALGLSCNLYFEKLGWRLGYPALRAAFREDGFRAADNLPESPKGIDVGRLAIGDEPAFTVTPREAWNYWRELTARLDRPGLGALRQGLRRAVREGTAKRVGAADLEILGKTGTGDSLSRVYPTNGWFLGAYSVERPRWLLLIFLQEAHGFQEAAELAANIYHQALRLGVLP